MEKIFTVEELEKNEVNLPESVKNPQPIFASSSEATSFYTNKLETLAQEKKMSLDEMKKAANAYKFGPDESFEILGFFDSISALKSNG